MTSEIEGNLGRTYTYDAVGQLTNVSYQDANANWSTSPLPGYDANGAVTGRTVGSTNWAYAYDQRGQMTSATQTGGGTVQQRVTYAYDAFGNRLSRADGSGTTRYALDLWDTAKPRYRWPPIPGLRMTTNH